jgi:AraC family transcriptional regulator of adaptative response / DNA-3-methyladenine glycosylase II
MLDRGHALVRVRPLPNRNELELTVRGAAPAALLQISTAARRVFDLAADPALIAQTFKADPLLAPLVRRRPGLRIPGVWDPFECAVRAVLGQQVSVAAGRTLSARLVARAGQSIESGSDGLTHRFPAPDAVAVADLSGLGITAARANALKILARAVADRTLDFTAPVEEVTAALANLAGFGDWTAQYVALRALGEPDAFPTADIVLRRMASAGPRPLTTRALDKRAEAWRPWRSYAVMHLWCAARNEVVS